MLLQGQNTCLNDHLVFIKILGIQSLRSINTCHKTTDQGGTRLASPGQWQWQEAGGKLATAVEHVRTRLKMQWESGRVVWSGKVGRYRKNEDLLEVVKKKIKRIKSGDSLAIQWLGHSTFTTEHCAVIKNKKIIEKNIQGRDLKTKNKTHHHPEKSTCNSWRGSEERLCVQINALQLGLSSLETGKSEFVKCFDCSLHGLLLAPSFLKQSLFRKEKQQGDVPGIHIQNLTQSTTCRPS